MTPARIQARRTPGWRKPDSCVIVDRRSRYGNPVTIADVRERLGCDEETARRTAVDRFDAWLAGDRDAWPGLATDDADRRREKILAALETGLLTGKALACTCADSAACHADILGDWAADPALAERVRRARARVERHRAAAALPLPRLGLLVPTADDRGDGIDDDTRSRRDDHVDACADCGVGA